MKAMLLPLFTGEGRERHGEILSAVSKLVDDDRLAVLLDDRRFDFREIAEAHRYWEQGGASGKILLVLVQWKQEADDAE